MTWVKQSNSVGGSSYTPNSDEVKFNNYADIRSHILSPFKRCNVAFLGDSISYGNTADRGNVEVDTLTISAGATTSGNITISLDGVSTLIAVSASDTVGAIGDKIRATNFWGWATDTNSGSATVTFTSNSPAVRKTPVFTDTGTTGTTASFIVTTAGKDDLSFAGRFAKWFNHKVMNLGKQLTVKVSHPEITITGDLPHDGTQLYTSTQTATNNVSMDSGITFSFYGTSFILNAMCVNNAPLLNVNIDGVDYTTVPLYISSGTPTATDFPITGLSQGNHTVKITVKQKQAGWSFYLMINSVKVTKIGRVENRAISGHNSVDISNGSQPTKTDDDVVFAMFGMNARNNDFMSEMSSFEANIKTYITSVMGSQRFILLSTIPAGYQDDDTRNFGTDDVDIYYRQIAERNSYVFVSNYQSLMDACLYQNQTLSYFISADNSYHPNNTGHDVIYRGILRTLGLPRTQDNRLNFTNPLH